MRNFVKIKNGVVVQKQPYAEKGFIEAPDHVICGQIANADGTYSNPPPQPDERPYYRKRESEYPSIGDQLDALWKELNYRRLNGDNLTSDADAILGKILAVKAKHPKNV